MVGICLFFVLSSRNVYQIKTAINELSGRIEELNRLFLVLPKCMIYHSMSRVLHSEGFSYLAHQVVLRALVRLCSRFAKNEAVHKMGAQNLAVVFTPNVLYNKV